jgi:hypothetical protein
MRTLAAGLFVVAGVLAGVAPARAEFKLTIHDGKVTLVADNVPARQILAEWARVGQTKVVNADKLTGPALTIRLEGVPERQALDVILRSASGFMVAERPAFDANASMYDRILIMPPSTPPAATAVGGRGPAGTLPPVPVAPPPMAVTPVDVAEADEDEPPSASPTGDARPPEANFDYANPQEFLRRRQELLQQQQQQAPGPPAVFPGTMSPYAQPPVPAQVTPTGVPTAPTGTARPGEMTKPPQVTAPTFANPYGIPSGMAPGSVAGPPMEPDRAKYANPYQPAQPPKQ